MYQHSEENPGIHGGQALGAFPIILNDICQISKRPYGNYKVFLIFIYSLTKENKAFISLL